MFPPSPPTLTDTESAEISTSHPKNWATFKTSCTCSTSLIKKISSPTQSLSKPSKSCSSSTLNTNWTAQQPPSDTCPHQVLMSTLASLVLQELFTAQNTEAPMKPSWECSNKSVRKRTSHNSLKTSKTERNCCTDLDTEFTNRMIHEQRSLNKWPMKCSKWLEKRSWLKLQLSCKRLLWAILTSLTESCILTLTFTAVSFTRQWVSQLTCSPCYSWSQDASDGWPTGVNFWTIQKTKSSDPDNITLEATQETTCQWKRDHKQNSTLNAQRQPTQRETLSQTMYKKLSNNDLSMLYKYLSNAMN